MKFDVKICDIVSEEYCFQKIRELRWVDSNVICPYCKKDNIVKNGGTPCQRYQCKSCKKNFNDLTETIFACSNLPLKTWVLCLYFMSLNLSNRQIAKELDLSEKTAYEMSTQLRGDIQKKGLSHNLMKKQS